MTNREIDKLIAEKVMGWTLKLLYKDHSVWFNDDDDIVMHSADLPDYSSNISDAWLVVEKMKEQLFSKRTNFAHELQRVISRGMGIEEGKLLSWQSVVLHITPITICLAALKALGVEVE